MISSSSFSNKTSSIPIKRIPTNISSDPHMVVAHFFYNGEERSRELIRSILQLNSEVIKQQIESIFNKYSHRHRNFMSIIQRNFENVQYLVDEEVEKLKFSTPLPPEVKNLIGAYFTLEYSISAGALFNPSIIPTPNSTINDSNCLDFVLSLRATGEGHISSIIFRTGHYLYDKDDVYLDTPLFPIKTPTLQRLFNYDKSSFNQKLRDMGVNDNFRQNFVNFIEGHNFSYQDFQVALKKFEKKKEYLDERDEKFWFNKIKWLAESHLELLFKETNEISERVIFPITDHERKGIEDARFVQFFDGDIPTYYGTYTAYDGRMIMPKLIHTNDFKKFTIRPLQGKKTYEKNFALFPRKINGQYAMLSRLDGCNHFIMYSNDIYRWNNAEKIETKKQIWELVQVGNCGSPLETSDGWLVISHGVGSMREYCLGVMLLDLENPLKVIAALPYPLMIPLENEREGYVPNVLYSCGSIIFKDRLIIPYACSDTRVNFATLSLSHLLSELSCHRI